MSTVFFAGRLAGSIEGRPGLLIGHLEKKKVGELLDVVSVRQPIVANVAVVPELLNDLLCVIGRILCRFSFLATRVRAQSCVLLYFFRSSPQSSVYLAHAIHQGTP